ncbi:MAG TPA: discoidin domain-containing protein [Bryobacteraceae bacterium]|nr:discoidin domain-containing protein [Bryobacteraceae bacterium]
MKRIAVLGFLAVVASQAQQYTRGLGVYPGDPREYFGPAIVQSDSTYRNLALRHAVYQSSAYDYNLTGQLVTDGIKEPGPPSWLVVATSSQGVLPKHERELLFDANWVTTVSLSGKSAWIQIELHGQNPPEIDQVAIDGSLTAPAADLQNWSAIVSTSEDGRAWAASGRHDGMARPTGEIRASVPLRAPSHSRYYRLEFRSGRNLKWRIGEVRFFDRGTPVRIGGPFFFQSAWMSAGAGDEWVYVDLGAAATFESVKLYWNKPPAAGALEVSDDAAAWRKLKDLPAGGGLQQEMPIVPAARGRYVRVRMSAPGPPAPDLPEGYVLSEFEVYGRGGTRAQPKAPPAAGPNGTLHLAGGAWRIARDSEVHAGGPALSTPGFPDRDWLVATVPGTVLASYYNAGALPDPNFGDQQTAISDSFFHADFWYRNEFTAPALESGRRAWLHFRGINWKADVFLNGEKIGRIEGAFQRGRFDVTSRLRPGQVNALAVRVEHVATPGAIKEKTFDSPGTNGGALGADNPTYHASIGWDWIPTIRGRNTGIWNEVYLETSGAVTIEDPFVSTSLPLPQTSTADVKMETRLRNHSIAAVTGTLRGNFGPAVFERAVRLEAGADAVVQFDASNTPALHLSNPKLWWPNGYGDPNLHPVNLRFETAGGQVSDTRSFQAGVRQFTYSEENGALRIWINGRRFVPRGGNWGFPESMLRYRGREYDAAVRYHRDMHFTMIRNWVGQIGEDAFYEACDRHGIVVWQDFWLANPWDGPNPDDAVLFLRNVEDTVLRIRNHASIGLYCGRNEGYPPETIEAGIRKTLAALHPGIEYIPSSADDLVSGHGPYRSMPPRFYFQERATPKFHSELGMPNIVTMDSLRLMMPESGMWPQGRMWGLHDFSLHGAQGGESFREQIDQSYGGASNAAEWTALAQFVNYEGYRAMFEAQGRHRMGLLIWMSHPAWPSLVWQTYDYYLEPTAAYFACKKASEPLHIQWNPETGQVEVVNYSAGLVKGLEARAELLNLDGAVQWQKAATLQSKEDSLEAPLRIEYPASLSAVHFIRLQLLQNGRPVSVNFYWRGRSPGDYRALRQLPKVRIESSTQIRREGDRWLLSTTLRNTSKSPVLLVRLKAVRETSGDRILPALYSDNYVSLMPGEERTIVTGLADADTRGERPRILLEGLNLAP